MGLISYIGTYDRTKQPQGGLFGYLKSLASYAATRIILSFVCRLSIAVYYTNRITPLCRGLSNVAKKGG